MSSSGWRGHANFGRSYPQYNRPQYKTQPKQQKRILVRQYVNQDGFALWCHAGGHAFDPLDRNKKRFTEDIDRYDSDGNPTGYTSITYMICGPCGKAGRFPGQSAPTAPQVAGPAKD